MNQESEWQLGPTDGYQLTTKELLHEFYVSDIFHLYGFSSY